MKAKQIIALGAIVLAGTMQMWGASPNKEIPAEVPDASEYEYAVYLSNSYGWNKVGCYVWDAGNDNKEYTAPWPGDQLTSEWINHEELYPFRLKVSEPLVKPMIIFNNMTNYGKTGDIDLINGAIYNGQGAVIDFMPVGVEEIGDNEATSQYFDMQGRRVEKPSNGIYIVRRSNGAIKTHIH